MNLSPALREDRYILAGVYQITRTVIQLITNHIIPGITAPVLLFSGNRNGQLRRIVFVKRKLGSFEFGSRMPLLPHEVLFTFRSSGNESNVTLNIFNRQAIQSIAVYFVKLNCVFLVHGEINLPACGRVPVLISEGRDSHIGKILLSGSLAGIIAEIISRNGLCTSINLFIRIIYDSNIHIDIG